MSGPSELGQNPFVGPRPIQQGEQLYGRSREVRELSEQVQGMRIVVLHSPSGAGKSSLVQAGLIPRLRKAKYDVWRPIRVNLDPTSFADVPADANRYLLSALLSLEDELPEQHRRSPSELAKLDFLDYIESRPRRKSRAAQSVVLLFDQFEEILSTDPYALEAKRAFFQTVGAALDTGRFWALFIIREDFLAALAPYRDLIPTQMSNTYRLDLLGLEGAREAAVELALSAGRAFPAADKLVRDLSVVQVQRPDGSFVPTQGIHIEPVYLQVVCRRLWAAMPDDDFSIDDEDVDAYGRVSTSLASYYADAVTALAGDDAALERSIRDWLGTRLIVGTTRSQVRQETGRGSGLDQEHIDRLLATYLIRAEQRAGATWYELSHDRLVEPVLDDNEQWRQAHLHPMQVQAKLWDEGGRGQALLLGADALVDANTWATDHPDLLTESEQTFLDLSRTLRAEEAAAQRRQRLFILGLAAVAAVALGFGVKAWFASQDAERRKVEAEAARDVAEDAKTQAEDAKSQAEHQKVKAENAKTLAEDAKSQAEQSQKENERSVRQMFEVSLRQVVAQIDERDGAAGVVEFDKRWTPLLVRDSRAVVVASISQPFRVVAASHRAFLDESDSNQRSLFLEITAEWLLADQARRRVAVVSPLDADAFARSALGRNLLALDYQYDVLSSLGELDALADTGMLILENHQLLLGADEVAIIESFVERGSGVLALGIGWEWLLFEGLDPAAAAPNIANYPMNDALASYGLRWTEGQVSAEELGRQEERVFVRFENKLDVEVSLFTVVGEREDLYANLAPGASRELLDALGSQWVFRKTGDDSEIGRATIKEQDQTVAISETVSQTKNKRPSSRPSTPATPEPTPTGPSGPGLPTKLSGELMKTRLPVAKAAAKKCGTDLQTLQSQASVKIEIGPKGKVEKVTVKPPVAGTEEASCLIKALEKLTFPPSKQGGTVDWKLRLY